MAYNGNCIVWNKRLSYRPGLMGEAAKPAKYQDAASAIRANFDSILQPDASARSLRVLIADDHEMVRIGLCALLQSHQIDVCAEAKNGEEAVEKSRQLSPDLIILDISMPVLGGIEAAQQIRVFLPDVPILFYSTHNTSQLVAIAKSVGAQGFVAKDQMAEALLEAVDALRDKKTFFSFGQAEQNASSPERGGK
jgi:DNA-binding NarL/FixJ family response regulator